MYDSDSGVFNALLNALKLSPLRWLNDSDMAIFCVAAVAVWKSLGYYLIIVLASIKTVPRDILEAAELDRTPPLRKFIKITLPMISPQLFFLLITITISSFKGYLDDVQAALTTAIAAGDSPVLADLSCNGIPLFASEGVLADMTPYIERDNFDMDNVVKELTDYVYYDKQVVTMPYTRGTAILYYNKDLYANAGLNQAPTSLEELNEYAKKIYDNSNGEVKGVGYTIEPTYYQHYLLESLNDVGFMDADGKGASCLDDGSMKQFLTDWYNWTEEGWCEIPALENASSAMQEDFYNGKLGAFVSSSNRATSISEKAQAAGINLGMSYTVGYGGYSAPLGGGSIGIIGKDHSQQEIAAAWEFVKFLMSDEQVAQNHIKTGVLPTTYSSVETDTLKDFWADEKNEGYKISYEQVKDASAPAMSMYTSEWNSAVRSVYSELIQARDITPDQALDNLKSEASTIFE